MDSVACDMESSVVQRAARHVVRAARTMPPARAAPIKMCGQRAARRAAVEHVAGEWCTGSATRGESRKVGKVVLVVAVPAATCVVLAVAAGMVDEGTGTDVSEVPPCQWK